MTKQLRVDHIGIAVENLEDSLAQYENIFGRKASAIQEVESEKVRLAFFDFDGVRLELLEATASESPVARFLEKRGPGIHHLSFAVDGTPLSQFLNELQSTGVPTIGDAPTPGSDNSEVFFLHPRGTSGVLLEFSSHPNDNRSKHEKENEGEEE